MDTITTMAKATNKTSRHIKSAPVSNLARDSYFSAFNVSRQTGIVRVQWSPLESPLPEALQEMVGFISNSVVDAEGFMVVRIELKPSDFVLNNREVGRIEKMIRSSLPTLMLSKRPVCAALALRSVREVWTVRIEAAFIPDTASRPVSFRKVTHAMTFSDDVLPELWYRFCESPEAEELWTRYQRHGAVVLDDAKSMGQRPEDNSRSRFRAAAADWLAELDEELAKIAIGSQQLLNELKEAIAARIEPALNEFVCHRPQEALEDKRLLASTINEHLQSLGLAIKCPDTGNPAIIVADQRSDAPDISRFRMRPRNVGSGRATKGTWRSLPHLEVIPDTGRVEPFAKWTQRSQGRKGMSKE